MQAVAAIAALMAAALWIAADRMFLQVWRGTAMSDRTRKQSEWSAATLVGLAVFGGLLDGWRSSVFCLVALLLLIISMRLIERDSPADQERRATPKPRPNYVPRWWPDDASTRYLASSPGRALGMYVPLIVLSSAILAWRIAGGDSMANELGDPWDIVVPASALAALSFNWVFAVRAIDALKRRRKHDQEL